jgi:hypothetical protein
MLFNVTEQQFTALVARAKDSGAKVTGTATNQGTIVGHNVSVEYSYAPPTAPQTLGALNVTVGNHPWYETPAMIEHKLRETIEHLGMQPATTGGAMGMGAKGSGATSRR